MCNNILQYGHLYAWGREHGRATVSMRFAYKYPFFAISESRHHNFAMYLAGKWGAGLGLLPVVDFEEGCDPDSVAVQLEKHRHVVAQGWYARFYDLFLKYRGEITDMFAINEEISAPVKARMQEIAPQGETLRLGVHIRRGDYARWMGGRYCYGDEVYAAYIKAILESLGGRKVAVFLSTNDPGVDEERFRQLTGCREVYNLRGGAADDLCMLSECDYLVGPPSTFSLVAAMYRDLPLCRMMTPDANVDFERFDTLFRKIV